ncbi:Phospholipase A2 [Caenorhabditis elegans]|uniref:Phospholipase A2 n=1 Tax=Caenorhabditis elegans TaxID=6239 RepID=Q20022_CAEEL|nr:Phospholipase A2 [Caenorhabditis elegans]CAA90245.2 Phospholipase A2 [Caenorhabditis elegans]|eukprot:NP_495739.2 Uncharacterized protein CELE_F35C11.5 [Caenorhabditis elegans]
MFLQSATLVIITLLPLFSGLEVRRRRSVAPFLGSGGSQPTGMLISPELWHCGSEGSTRNYTYQATVRDCPSLAAALNHCCAIHDDCYGQQKGQEKCDEDFCECNRMVTRLPTEEGYKCRAAADDACLILAVLGWSAYGDSNYTDPTKPSANVLVTPETVPKMESDFMNLYSKCPYANITLASCANNFDLCAVVHSVDFCANDLCHCMLDAAESDDIHKKECSPAVAHTCRAVLRHSSDVLASRSVTRNFIIIALLVLAAASVGFGLFFMYTRVAGERKKVEEGKYLQIHTVESARSVNPLLLSAD